MSSPGERKRTEGDQLRGNLLEGADALGDGVGCVGSALVTSIWVDKELPAGERALCACARALRMPLGECAYRCAPPSAENVSMGR